MEYRIETTTNVADEEILNAVKSFLYPASGLPPGYITTNQAVEITLPGRHTSPSGSRATATAGPGRFNVTPRSIDRRSMANVSRPTVVRFIPISRWGGTDRYYFWVKTDRLLSLSRLSWQPRWSVMTSSWQKRVSVQSIALQPLVSRTRTGSAVGQRVGQSRVVLQMTDTEKLTEAIQRSLPRIPGHLKKAVEEFLTPANIAIVVGLTVVLMASGVGEVLGLGLLVIGAVAGGIDLCVNVLRMVFEFYQKATDAQSEADLDEAADLFAQIVLRGGVDLLDILVGRRAAAKLAGRGLSSVGAYLAYLEEEMKLWRGRQVSGGSTLRQGAAAAEEEAEVTKGRTAAPSVVRRLPKYRTRPPFKKNPAHSQAEFDRQIQGQQDGLNKMTVEEYLKNSDRYKAQGRAGAKAQEAARNDALERKTEEYIRQGKSLQEAEVEAERWIRTQDALHNPDQIAGGHPDYIEGMGDKGVNRSIGSQWEKRGISKNMDDYIRDQAKNMTPEELRTTKLDVELDH